MGLDRRTGIKKMKEKHPKLEEAKCCGNCKHSHYSTATLSSCCNKHTNITTDEYCDTSICEDFEF